MDKAKWIGKKVHVRPDALSACVRHSIEWAVMLGVDVDEVRLGRPIGPVAPPRGVEFMVVRLGEDPSAASVATLGAAAVAATAESGMAVIGWFALDNLVLA